MRFIVAVLLALLLAVGAGVPAQADPFEQGMAQFKRGEFEAAYKLWRPLAERGDALAQLNVGNLFERGQGVTQDSAEAAQWWLKAASRGVAQAQNNLGAAYLSGQGVATDYVQADKWLSLAVRRGYADAKKPREVVETIMSAAEIAEAQKLVRDWKQEP